MRTEQGYLRALLIAAPTCLLDAYPDGGEAIAQALEIPYPLTMPSVWAAAVDSGFQPYDLWPWLIAKVTAA